MCKTVARKRCALLRSAFGIALRLTVSINVHGAFPKIDRLSGRSCPRERTLQDSYTNSSVCRRSACKRLLDK
ncbi:MAG: hypothetical protein EHM73_01215 [Chroococcales cyanobacterium metabat2.561]|uniref:Uncharacterized protein n=1 Tax=Microcystis aeruginosa Ma_SC_T_19800800_S464 TaxID=2486257 RepID=A0A552DHV6_MICAE|nr:MAG: hypothetical protein EHM73_01215 [Chroococcales cyanobacterium metabat2.561]TRU21799.1 MAG: hypothetical protein EWV81_19590 [Microcystis aeruginosa Ma_SC_T_19800800_S464]